MATSVLITRQPDNRYTARALVLPEIVVTGATEAEAVEQLRVALADLQQHSRVIQVDLPITDTAAHPWLRFAGITTITLGEQVQGRLAVIRQARSQPDAARGYLRLHSTPVRTMRAWWGAILWP